jgi:hypothetical protein
MLLTIRFAITAEHVRDLQRRSVHDVLRSERLGWNRLGYRG